MIVKAQGEKMNVSARDTRLFFYVVSIEREAGGASTSVWESLRIRVLKPEDPCQAIQRLNSLVPK